MYCKNCGTEVNDDSKFCKKCGKALKVSSSQFKEVHNSQIEPPKPETATTTWIVLVVIIMGIFVFMYELVSEESLFESKSSKCEIEAQERSVTIRDSRLNILKAKNSLTKYELEEMERLEGWKNEGMYGRDDFKYYYDFCMNK